MASDQRIPTSESFAVEWSTVIRAARNRLGRHKPKWARMLQQYTGVDPDLGPGVHPDVADMINSEVRFNFVVSQANTILPTVINTHPYLLVKPRRPQDKRAAFLAQHALNRTWVDEKATREIKRLVLDALLFGIGVGKVVYDPADHVLAMPQYRGLLENAEPDTEPAEQRRLLAALGPAADESLSDPKDNPRLVRIPPDRLLTPDGYADIREMPWIGEILIMPLKALKADGRFKLPKGLEPDVKVMSTLRKNTIENQFVNNQDDSEIPDAVIVYEIRYYAHTREGMRRRVLYMLDERYADVLPQERVIRHVDDQLRVDGYPYEILRFVDVPDDFHSTSVADLAVTAEVAQKLNKVIAGVLAREKSNSKNKLAVLGQASDMGALDALLESDNEYAWAAIEGSDDIRKLIAHIPKAPMTQDTLWTVQKLQALMYEVGGVSTYQRGGIARKGTTATEVAATEGHSQGRASIRKNETEAFIAGVARKFLQVMQQEWDRSRYIRVTGADGAEEQELVNLDDLQGLLDVDILVGSLQAADPAQEQNAWLGFMATVRQTMETAMPLVEMGILDREQIRLWFDRTVEVWNQDRRELLGPMAQFQLMAGGQSAGAPAPINGNGAGPDGESLAGEGPRPGAGGMDLSALLGMGGPA